MDSPLPYHPLGGSEVLHQSGDWFSATFARASKTHGPGGPNLDSRLMRDAVMGADMVVVAWGDTNRNRLFRERAQRVTDFLRSLDKQIHCLGKISYGSPKHPARGTNRLQPWR